MRRRAFLGAMLGAGLGLAGRPVRAQRIRMISTGERLRLTHQTRFARLRRIVGELGIVPEPTFHEYVIPAAKMPPDFPYDVPVLRIVFPERNFFDTARAELVQPAQPVMMAMAEMLQGDVPDVAVFVAGHTDSRGSEAYNQDLSVRRARTVAEALRNAGASNPRLWSIGFGESLPLVENAGAYNMSLNRRVEFLLSDRLEAVAHWMKEQLALACSEGVLDSRGRCIKALKVRASYTAEPVQRTTLAPPPHVRSHLDRPTAVVAVRRPEPKIVISLRERRYVVGSIEH